MPFPKGAPRPPNAGRKKGTQNKATMLLQKQVEERLGRRVSMRPNSLDELRKAAMLLSTLAAREMEKGAPGLQVQRDEDGNVVSQSKTGYDPSFLSELSEKAGKMWEKVANFEFPRLSAVTLHQQPLDLSKLTDNELAELERIVAAASDARDVAGGATSTHH
jgi:hypothetical protein